jgi:hypothetical protein
MSKINLKNLLGNITLFFFLILYYKIFRHISSPTIFSSYFNVIL